MDVVKLFEKGIVVTKSNPVMIVPYLVVNIATTIAAVILAVTIFGQALGMTGMTGMSGMSGGFGAGPSSGMMMGGIGSMMGGMFLFLALFLLFIAIGIGATVAMAYESAQTGKTSLNTGFGIVQRRFIDIITTIILMGIIIGIGFVLLILPGLIAFFLFLLTYPALIIGNLGPVAALKKSYEVMTKNMGDGIILFIGIIAITFLSGIINMFFGMIPIIGSLIGMVVGAVFTVYMLVVQVLFYLEATKE